MSEKKTTRRRPRNTGLELKTITPLTTNQTLVFERFERNHLVLQGWPGTGKTFLAVALALKAVEKGDYSRIIIVRSAVAGRDIGFLPGTEEEKMAVFEEPYTLICNDLYGRGDAYDILKQHGIIQFTSSSFKRGITAEDAVIIIDEAQNFSDKELFTLVTRVGVNTKLVICGDVNQDDLTNERLKEFSGLRALVRILQVMNSSIFFVDFGIDDIVRSEFVREFIIAKERLDSERRKIQAQKTAPVKIMDSFHFDDRIPGVSDIRRSEAPHDNEVV